MKKQSLGQAIKSDLKQWLWDAADTLLRTPTRIAGIMGLKQSQRNKSPNNKGEQAMNELFDRTIAAGKTFAKWEGKVVKARKELMKKK